VIAATHRPVHELRSRGIFREDFYYRLCSDTITVPPLRERFRQDPMEREDLLEHVLLRTLGAPEPQLTELVRRALRESVPEDYDWPGNVREFEQAVRRILITQRYVPTSALQPNDATDRLLAQVKEGALDADQLLAGYCRLLYERSRNFEAVARLTRLDRRTVKRYLGLNVEKQSPAAAVN
jgi:transcriptional regulator of acetoin/glycerol metabolism